MNVVHKIDIREKNSMIDLGEVPRGKGRLKFSLESVSEALAAAVPDSLLQQILCIMNKFYDQRATEREARAFVRNEAPHEKVYAVVDVVAPATRSPVAAVGVREQHKVRKVAQLGHCCSLPVAFCRDHE